MCRFVFACLFLLGLAGAAGAADPIAELQNAFNHNKALRHSQIQLCVAAAGQDLAIEVLDGEVKVRNLIHSGTDVLSPQFSMEILLKAGGPKVHDAVAALRAALAELQKQNPGRKIKLTAALNTPADQAIQAMASGDAEKALACFREGAAQGSAMCQYQLAYCYYAGLAPSTPKDPAKVVEWVSRAAGQGMPEAMNLLGGLYLFEKDYPRDPAKGFEWTLKAAEMDFAPAQSMMGYLLRHGVGTAKDPAKAVAWLRKAIDQGDARALIIMAGCLAEGRGVAKDFAKTKTMLQQAIDQASDDERNTIFALNSQSWLMATCEDSQFLDGRAAVDLAGKALAMIARRTDFERYEPMVMDTLAAAYARRGEYDKAIETQ